MKTVLTKLKDKLNTLGYNENVINSVLHRFNLESMEKYYANNDFPDDFVTVEEFEEPNVEIIQLLLNITENIIQAEVLEGDIMISSTATAVGTRVAIADYSLSKRCAVMGISSENKAHIIIYKPNTKVQNLYKDITYEQNYKEDRDDITRDYFDAFVQNGRVTERKVKEIITMLVADFVIDEMAVYDANPRIKLYDNEQKYAENLYSYSLRYINLRTNRIEILNRTAKIKMSSKNVQPGLITNDPYIKIDKLPQETDFPLNTISYYWLYANKNNQEEIAVFVPPKTYAQAQYSELKLEDPRFDEMSMELVRKFRRDIGIEMDPDDIKNVLKKLNVELMIPSINIIRSGLTNRADMVEPIRYKFQAITDPAEFEEKLYITIEDNVSRRYKYMLVENVLDDLTTIGNKLEYTDEKGNLVRKQSVADFNVNAPAVIIRRETFTDITKIPDLLGYIYEDMKYYGTEGLPVPSIEIDFYLPINGVDKSNVVMYNGTMPEFAKSQKHILFNSNDATSNTNYMFGAGNILPGSTYVTVKYVNSKGEILKENKIGNVFPRGPFLPDIIPIINDKDGKEWKAQTDGMAPFILTSNPEENIVEVQYVENYARVNVSFINREGKNIIPDKQEILQVGTNYDFLNKELCVDSNDEEWKLMFAKPSKLVVKEEEEKNKIILVYDIERADVTIQYLTISGNPIASDRVVQGAVDKVYHAEKIPYIVDENGYGWDFVESSNAAVMVSNASENIIKLLYQEAKRKVIVRIKSADDVVLKDDVIEFIQIGQKFSTNFAEQIEDYEGKEWILNQSYKNEMIVQDEEANNLLEAIYMPKLAKVTIKYLSEDGRPIREAEIEEAQVGSRFNAEGKNEIMDNFGKSWKWKDKSPGILISEVDIENSITLVYEPLISKVTIHYLDSEMKELIPPKYENLQAGTVYKNTPIQKITDDDGKKWIVDYSKVPSITVKKYEEENIVTIYYDKETTKVTLTFFDAYNNELRESQIVDSQIGAPLESDLYSKITDIHGNRWMIASSEPKNLTVRETGNAFKLIYDEMKAKVLVKHINVNTQKAFVEDIVTTVKLGGIFIPNIRKTVLDKNKWQYKYIGDENISIVTQENEQENIIVLTYDEDKSNVILKYRNDQDQKIREDAVKQVQIGKEIVIDAIPKFNDNEGLGWQYDSSDCDTKVVMPEDNIIMNHYVPLMATIVNHFENEEGKEIVSQKEDTMQVGKKYVPQIVQKVADLNGAVWKYESLSEEEIIVKDDINVIVHHYSKLNAKVTVNYLDEDGELIDEPIVHMIQVGTAFAPEIKSNYEDTEGKAWLLDGVDREKIKALEDETKNIINVKYRKELVDVKLYFFNMELQTIRNEMIVREQIGSMYLPSPDQEIIDSNSLGWNLKRELLEKVKINRDPAQNVINISYDKLLVDTTVTFRDDNNEDVIPPNITKHQVGTSFMPVIEDYIEDAEGKEWIHAIKQESKFFTTGRKVNAITVARDEKKNFIHLHYRPSMNKVVVRYVNPLGADIKPPVELQAQIGSKYTPQIIEKIVGTGNKKWVYNPNSNSTIKMDKIAEKNVVNLAYEEEKAAVIYIYKSEDGDELIERKKVLAQIGTIYQASPENIIEDSEGKVWEYKAKSLTELTVNEDDKQNIIDVVYSPLRVDVIIKFATLNGNQIIPDQIQKAQLGSIYHPTIDETIADAESKQFKFVKCEPEEQKIKEVPLGSEAEINVYTLTYQALFSKAVIHFKDMDGNSLKEDEEKEMQVGMLFTPTLIQYISDNDGIQWELVTKKIDPFRISGDIRDNEVTMVYEVAKAEVSVRYKDMDGNAIREADIYHLEVGSEFIPDIKQELIDSKERKWSFAYADPIKLTVGSINNIINVIYQEKKVMTIVKIQSTDGKELKPDIRSKQQVGIRYSPKPQMKVIYDANDLWRYAYNSPQEIIISENAEENVIIQYYTNDDNKEKEKTNSNGYTAEMEKFIDEEMVAAAEREEQEKLEEEQRRKEEELKNAQEAVKFEDAYLQKLEQNIKLSNSDKLAINKLNDCNTEIMKTLHEALSSSEDLEKFGLKDKLNSIVRKEKTLVQEDLKNLLEEDTTGNKLLKIMEAITMSEIEDKDFKMLQQKKSILFADYFVTRNVTDIEQANYIVERGKVEKGIECINQKINMSSNKDETLAKVKVILIYEEVMLDNYYRARSVVKDDYFKNEESKSKMSNEVIVLVTNMIPEQAKRLLGRFLALDEEQKNDLEALLRLMTAQQQNNVLLAINKIPDGKTRKMASKFYKEVVGK